MKRKKFERQQLERSDKEKQKKQAFWDSLKVVKLNPRNDEKIEYIKEYSWKCPKDHGSFTYSKKINDQWGHPHDLVFCAVCRNYFRFEIDQLVMNTV